jgi:hypothetical protein
MPKPGEGLRKVERDDLLALTQRSGKSSFSVFSTLSTGPVDNWATARVIGVGPDDFPRAS